MRINTYVMFNGRCEEAFRFYEKALGGKIVAMMTHKGTPAEQHVPANWGEKIIHAALSVGDQMLMGSDSPPEHYQKPAGFSVALHVKDPAEAERYFNALADKGAVTMPIAETFWSPRFGMLVDRFGIPWMINTEPKS